MAKARPERPAALQTFSDLVTSCTFERQTVDKHGITSTTAFVSTTHIKRELAVNGYALTNDILDAVLPFPERSNVSAREVASKCPVVLTILLRMDRGQLITHFLNHVDLQDHQLPFIRRPVGFPQLSDISFYEFKSYQWLFCAPVFTSRRDQLFENEIILPFTSKTCIRNAKNSALYKVNIHPDHDAMSIYDQSRITTRSSNHCYAIKTYSGPHAGWYYEREVHAFTNLLRDLAPNGSSAMIGYFGCYVHLDTYNIILEYADGGTIEDYFRTQSSPSIGLNITAFWRGLTKVFEAVDVLHNQQLPEDDPRCKEVLQGWHQDIKPTNILVVKGDKRSPYEWSFKLADLGLSHFEAITSTSDESVLESFGTKTYGAPECCGWSGYAESHRRTMKQGTDIWSLGCVLNEAAVWTVHGWEGPAGLEAFRQERASNKSYLLTGSLHDLWRLRIDVERMNKVLIFHVRQGDLVTTPIMTSLITAMLRPKNTRLDVKAAFKLALSIIDKADSKHNPSSMMHGANTEEQKSEQAMTVTPTRGRFPVIPQAVDRSSDRVTYTQDWSAIPSYMNSAYMSPGYTRHSTRNSQYTHLDTSSARQSVGSARYSDLSYGSDRYGTRSSHYTDSGYGSDRQSLRSIYSTDSVYDDPLASNPGRLARSTLVPRVRDSTDVPPIPGHRSTRLGFRPNPAINSGQVHRIQHPLDNPLVNRNFRPQMLPRLATEVESRSYKDSQNKQPETNEAIPFLSVAEARESPPSGQTLPAAVAILEHIQRRDHLFIIDDSSSMMWYTLELVNLLGTLICMTKDYCRGGPEVHFMNARQSKRFLGAENLKDYVFYSGDRQASDARTRLQEILRRAQARLNRKKRIPPLSIYIMTDGKWRAGCDAADMIRDLEKVIGTDTPNMFPTSIQFIRFGQHLEGQARLQTINDHFRQTSGIVDVEESNGNVWKMLLGTTNSSYEYKKPQAMNTKLVIEPLPHDSTDVYVVSDLQKPMTDPIVSGEAAWRAELGDLGMSEAEISELLSARENDSPWIYMESPPPVLERSRPQKDKHLERCAHTLHITADPSLHKALPALAAGRLSEGQPPLIRDSNSMDAADLRDLVATYCGLGGVAPISRDSESWAGQVSWDLSVSPIIAKVSHSRPDDEVGFDEIPDTVQWTRLLGILKSLCALLGRAQKNGLICDSFTALRSCQSGASISSQVELVRIHVYGVVGLMDDINAALSGQRTVTQCRPAASIILSTVMGIDFDPVPLDMPRADRRDEEITLHICCLATQVLCLAFLSYSQGHTGTLRPYFVDRDIGEVHLFGSFPNSDGRPPIVMERAMLSCIGEMLQDQILVFTDPWEHLVGRRKSLLASPEDILDTWGPGSYIVDPASSSPNNIKAVLIGGGHIVAEMMYISPHHWTAGYPKVDGVRGRLNATRKIEVDALVMINQKCGLAEQDFLVSSEPFRDILGPIDSYWELLERQIGAQAGQYINLQTNMTWVRRKGATLKEQLMLDISDELPWILESTWGLRVSCCSGVAQRVKIRELLVDLLPRFAERLPSPHTGWTWLKETFDVLEKLKAGEPATWLADLRAQDTEQYLLFCSLVRRLLATLEKTGIEPNGRCFVVAWLPATTAMPIQCIRTPCRDTAFWVQALADSIDCATFAYYSIQCLEIHGHGCQTQPPRQWGQMLLVETEVHRCRRDVSKAMKLESQWTLNHGDIYPIGKHELLLQAVVERPLPASTAGFIIRRSALPLDIFHRLMAKRKDFRVRERQAVTDVTERVFFTSDRKLLSA